MPANNSLLPWHEKQWSVLKHALTANQFPPGLLLHGPEGVGKKAFLEKLAAVLVCSHVDLCNEQIKPCGQCRSCQQFSEDGEHADIMQLGVAEGEREIKIDRARAAIEFANLAAHYGGRKLLIIHQAEKLNRNAANALLKTLEEPPESTTVILSSARPARLMPTIRSRCQQLRFTLPAQDVALRWLVEQGINNPEDVLREANGSPLSAQRLSAEGEDLWRRDRDKELQLFINEKRSPSRLAKHWLQFEPTQVHAWLYDRLRRLNWQQNGLSGLFGANSELKTLADSLTLQDSESLLSSINEFGRLEVNNINKQLCLESILMDLLKKGA